VKAFAAVGRKNTSSLVGLGQVDTPTAGLETVQTAGTFGLLLLSWNLLTPTINHPLS
jgi:hypothetical protein